MAVSIPVLLLLVDWYESPGKVSRKGLMDKIPFFLASLLFVGLTYGAQQAGGATVPVREQPWIGNILSMAYSYGFYVLKTVLPLNLSSFYSLNRYAPESQGMLLCCLFPACLLLGTILWSRQGDRHVLFGLLFYLVTLLPVAGLIRFGPVLVADRFSYFPSLGLSFSIGWAASLFVNRGFPDLQRLVRIPAILLLVMLALLTALQGRIWKDSFHLWTSVLEKDPSCGPAWGNLCSALLQEGKPKQAIHFCSRALELTPGNHKALLNRGIAALQAGHSENASRDFGLARRIAPEDPLVTYAEGLLKAHQGDPSAAAQCFQQVLSRFPYHKEAAGMLGVLSFQGGAVSRAIESLENAVEWGSRDEVIYGTLLDAYLAEKRFEDALSLCDAWLPWATNKAAIAQRICLLKLWQGFTEEARECFTGMDG